MPFRRTSIDSNQRTGFYSPKRSRVVGSRVVGYDSDALVYINAVEAADGQALEGSVKDAYNTFVVGCKSDGIWNAIKASCIMAGARTLSGALVPLVGVAPSGFNFASGDYSRTTGLVGNGSTKYLDTNRAVTADPQNNCHISSYVASVTSGAAISLGSIGLSSTGASVLAHSNPIQGRLRCTNYKTGTINASPPSFAGFSRSSSLNFVARSNGSGETITESSTAYTIGGNYTLHRFQSFYYSPRISFYSIGENLDLALLDARVDRLVNDIAFFINTGLSPTAYDIDTLKYVNRGYAAGGSLS